MQAMLMCMSGHSRRNKIATSFTALCVCTCSRDCISYMIFAFFVSVSLLVSLYVFLGVSLCLCVALPPSLIPVCLSLLPSLCLSVHTEQSVLIYSVSPLVRNCVSQFANCASHTHTHTQLDSSSPELVFQVEAVWWCQCIVLLGWSLELKQCGVNAQFC